eukprot:6054339-Amphidinium_carterae.1
MPEKGAAHRSITAFAWMNPVEYERFAHSSSARKELRSWLQNHVPPESKMQFTLDCDSSSEEGEVNALTVLEC